MLSAGLLCCLQLSSAGLERLGERAFSDREGGIFHKRSTDSDFQHFSKEEILKSLPFQVQCREIVDARCPVINGDFAAGSQGEATGAGPPAERSTCVRRRVPAGPSSLLKSEQRCKYFVLPKGGIIMNPRQSLFIILYNLLNTASAKTF